MLAGRRLLSPRVLAPHLLAAAPRAARRMSSRAAAAKTALVPVADGSEEMEVSGDGVRERERIAQAAWGRVIGRADPPSPHTSAFRPPSPPPPNPLGFYRLSSSSTC